MLEKWRCQRGAEFSNGPQAAGTKEESKYTTAFLKKTIFSATPSLPEREASPARCSFHRVVLSRQWLPGDYFLILLKRPVR